MLTLCLGKSTYARCGIIVNVTPLEPEWEGHVTLEFSNTTSLPAKISANEGVAQFIFLESDEVCETSYKDRDGKMSYDFFLTLYPFISKSYDISIFEKFPYLAKPLFIKNDKKREEKKNKVVFKSKIHDWGEIKN